MISIKKLKTTENICFLTTFLIGFVVHLFGSINILHNYDDIECLPLGFGQGVTSGRWVISTVGRILAEMGLAFNLSYVNTILFILLIAISVKYIVQMLDIKNPLSVILIGAAIVVFPTATGTLMFKFAAGAYGIAMLCAVMAVWCLDKFKYGFILSSFLIAGSLGIYQAYVPVTITLMVLLLLKQALTKNSEVKDVIKHGLKYAGILIFGLIVYYIFLKITLAIFGTQLSTYQGIDKALNVGGVQI